MLEIYHREGAATREEIASKLRVFNVVRITLIDYKFLMTLYITPCTLKGYGFFRIRRHLNELLTRRCDHMAHVQS